MSDTAADATDTTTTARDGSSSLLRSNVVVATGTALSRITGLARVAAFGYVIGQTALADAYRIGNETPNIVYEVLLGGVVSATFVPLFTDFKERDDVNWQKHTLCWVDDAGNTRIEYRPVHMNTLTKDVEPIPPKARTY